MQAVSINILHTDDELQLILYTSKKYNCKISLCIGKDASATIPSSEGYEVKRETMVSSYIYTDMWSYARQF